MGFCGVVNGTCCCCCSEDDSAGCTVEVAGAGAAAAGAGSANDGTGSLLMMRRARRANRVAGHATLNRMDGSLATDGL